MDSVADIRGKTILITGAAQGIGEATARLCAERGAKVLLADRGREADLLRKALAKRRIEACIPSKFNRNIQIHHDRALYRKRHRIETHSESSRTGRVSPPAMTDAPRRARSVP